ncbi:hypothetical protein DLJ54_04875 [Corynebacterium heidelbergense]|uniref:Uncharacterized protein n=2 Tax=Corynebacterium heidelbergense TaxID=2055947 RepID=A0A364V675_9CORY|nr:hypothetical protein DLJ54_04875 [Corynebacterium heidelbergense]
MRPGMSISRSARCTSPPWSGRTGTSSPRPIPNWGRLTTRPPSCRPARATRRGFIPRRAPISHGLWTPPNTSAPAPPTERTPPMPQAELPEPPLLEPPEHAERVRDTLRQAVEALTACDYSEQMVHEALGEAGLTALAKRCPAGARRRLRLRAAVHAVGEQSPAVQSPGCRAESSSDPAQRRAQLIVSTVYLRTPHPRADLEAIFGPSLTEELVDTGLWRSTGAGVGGVLPDLYAPSVDIRPIRSTPHGGSEIIIASDADASLDLRVPRSDFVPGVGNAPRSLLGAIPPRPGRRILDLGCGSGVLGLILATADPHAQVTATDISPRALMFAAASAASVTDGRVRLLHGSWFDPVEGEEFDTIVCNPPFLIGPGAQRHVYRDGGLELDGASRLVISQAPDYLADGGSAHLLASWALGEGESAAQRVTGWIPDRGVRTWVVQREEVNIEEYVATWIADEAVDPRSAEGTRLAEEWLDYLEAKGIHRIGFGWVHMRRIEGPSEVTVETMDHPLAPGAYLGTEVAEWFQRAEWVAQVENADVLRTSFAVRPTVALETVDIPDGAARLGFVHHHRRLVRTDGPAWSHDIDEHLQAILAGLSPHGLDLGDVVELYCAARDISAEQVREQAATAIVELVRHGLVLPAELIAEDTEEV